jgi:hypothetical protein
MEIRIGGTMNQSPQEGEQLASEPGNGWLHGISYYVLIGIVTSIYAAWVSLGLSILWWLSLGQEPFKLLRVYATFFQGAEALTLDANLGIVIVLALVLHSVTGAIVGTPLFVVYHRFFPGQSSALRAVNGAWLGILIWVINFYAILTWLQPMMLKGLAYTGEPRAYIVENMPWWAAALTHLCFTEVITLMQPGRSQRKDDLR